MLLLTTITTGRCVKVMTNPASGNIVVRGKAEGPKCGGMASTFITQISTVTAHALHGESKFALSENHGSLTRECQLNMCTSLDGAQANTSSVLRIKLDTRLLITGYWKMRSKKRQCFDHGSHFSGAVRVSSGTEKAR